MLVEGRRRPHLARGGDGVVATATRGAVADEGCWSAHLMPPCVALAINIQFSRIFAISHKWFCQVFVEIYFVKSALTSIFETFTRLRKTIAKPSPAI